MTIAEHCSDKGLFASELYIYTLLTVKYFDKNFSQNRKMQPESYPVVMREKAFSAPVLSSSKRRKKTVVLRNGLFRFAKCTISGHEMHHIGA